MPSTFALDVREFVKKTKLRADAAVRGIVTYIVVKIDSRSPVGNPSYWKSPAPRDYKPGRFRKNWQLSIGSPIRTPVLGEDASGTATVSSNLSVIPDKAAGHVYYFANNLDYARRLEDGYSPQSGPNAMVGLTMVEAEINVKQAVAKAKAAYP